MKRWLPIVAAVALLLLTLPAMASSVHYVDNQCPKNSDLAVALSDLNYVEAGSTYWTVRDSGDGTSTWLLYAIGLKYDPSSSRFRVKDCLPLMWPGGPNGPERQANGAELDPEGIVWTGSGWWIAEEYGPSILYVDQHGYIRKQVIAPQFIVDGRKPGRGFEGITADPATGMIYAILQQGLVTDPLHTYITGWDDAAGTWTVWDYTLEDPADYTLPTGAWVGSSGIHAVGERTLLVIERDNQDAATAAVKQIWKATLPAVPGQASKQLVSDVLAMSYPYEKLEGITIGPGGSITVINDNDGDPSPDTTEVWQWSASY